MNQTRQDAWTQEEDDLLAGTVLSHIREGKTQLEAFNEVGKQLSRTPAACGFRWNAAIRKQYPETIEKAREERKQNNQKQVSAASYHTKAANKEDPITAAISLLEQMRYSSYGDELGYLEEQNSLQKQLIEENKALKEQLHRYDQAWEEMGKLWNWVKEPYK